MRIAHVTDVYLPRLGGVELQVNDLAARQRSAGHDVVVVTTTPAGATHAERVPAIRLGDHAFTAGIGPYRAVRDHALGAMLRTMGVDVAHAHVSAFSPLAWTAARLASTTRLPTVVSVHSMWHDIAPLMRTYARWQDAGSFPVQWAAVSTAAAAAVRGVLDGTPVAVLPNGIDPAMWLRPDRPSGGPATIVSVLRMVRRKRPKALLRTLLAIRGAFRAVLVGDGPLLAGLRRQVVAAGREPDILVPGALDRAQIRELLAGADLYLAPAPRESFGIAALEARSAGVPVMARVGSGVSDFVTHGVEGWLVDSDDAMRSTVDDLLADPLRLAAAARHNRAVPPRVDWSVTLGVADALYAAAAQQQSATMVPGGQR